VDNFQQMGAGGKRGSGGGRAKVRSSARRSSERQGKKLPVRSRSWAHKAGPRQQAHSPCEGWRLCWVKEREGNLGLLLKLARQGKKNWLAAPASVGAWTFVFGQMSIYPRAAREGLWKNARRVWR